MSTKSHKKSVIYEVNKEVGYFLEKYNLTGNDFVYEIDTASIKWPVNENLIADKNEIIDVKIKFPNKREYKMIFCYSKQYEGGIVFSAYVSKPLKEVIDQASINEEAVGNWDWIIIEDMSKYKESENRE